jgi:uncharacterized protein involved in exopolysaccharide biosynthesis
VPAIAVAIVFGVVVLVRKPTWEASQALVVRNEAVGTQDIPGKFRHSDELKAILDTVLELSKSRTVLLETLVEVGPPADYADPSVWPTDGDIDGLLDGVKVSPPKGAEFGKTEIFYLKVKSSDRERAVALANALCGRIEAHYGRVRNDKAESAMSELAESHRLALADVHESTVRLTSLETEVGGDLSELRHLHQGASNGDSDLRRRMLEMQSELRQARVALGSRKHLLEALQDARIDNTRLLSLPNGMLETLPALRKSKDNLIDAQVRTSTLLGSMSSVHPSVRAAVVAERELASHLNEELTAAIRGVEIDRQAAEERVASLVGQVNSVEARLQRLAGMRAEYSATVAEAEQRSKLASEVERKLVEARAAHASAEKASLISRVDSPDTGSKPVGPSTTILLLAGLAGGLVVGAGVLVLTVEPSTPVRPIVTSRSLADLDLGRDLEFSKDSVRTPVHAA